MNPLTPQQKQILFASAASLVAAASTVFGFLALKKKEGRPEVSPSIRAPFGIPLTFHGTPEWPGSPLPALWRAVTDTPANMPVTPEGAHALEHLGRDFVPKLVALSREAGIDPLGACAVMLYESGLQPGIVNSIGAVGINQFIPQNYGAFAPLTLAQYRSLSASEQLPYVFKFWRNMVHAFGHGQKFFEGRDLYWLNILPGTFIPNHPDDFKIPFTTGQYEANKGLDHGKKGYITPGDFSLALADTIRHHAPLWSALRAAIGNTGPAIV